MRRRTGFLLGILFELLAIFGLFVPYVLLSTQGTVIRLQTVPVDPTSVFRGDYVSLGYVAGNGVAASQVNASDGTLPDLVYIVLAQKGDLYDRVSISPTKPALLPGQVCLRAVPQNTFFGPNGGTVTLSFPDIAQYFVTEGLGQEFQQAAIAHSLYVDVAVSPSCDSVIKDVIFGPQASSSSSSSLLPAAKPVPVR